MIRLDDVGLFMRVASTGSFSAAARDANLQASQVSVAVRRLELALGVDLFVRTTRSLRLTHKGEQYLSDAEEILSAVRVGRDSVRSRQVGFDGDLSLRMPCDIDRGLLSGWIAAFHRSHPGLRIRLVVADGFTDGIVFDAVIRYGDGSRTSHPSAVLSAHNRAVLVASPEYVSRRGPPGQVNELRRHDCIAAGGPDEDMGVWLLQDRNGDQAVEIRPTWTSHDGDLARRWAIQGMGVALRPWLEVARDLAEGCLVQVLPTHCGRCVPLVLECTHQGVVPAAVAALADDLAGRFSRFGRRYPPPFPA